MRAGLQQIWEGAFGGRKCFHKGGYFPAGYCAFIHSRVGSIIYVRYAVVPRNNDASVGGCHF
jgi:hypothetical protein